jgi:hypothetical protein
MATSKNTIMITPEQILAHRESRMKSGMVGCVTGRPVPAPDFFGYRDVQIWNMDANGRMNGDPGFDRKNPRCFCFDCRGAFDPKGEVDAEIVNAGHERAREVYMALLVNPVPSPPPPAPTPTPTPPPSVPLPMRTNTHYPGVLSCEEDCWCGYWENKNQGGAAGAGAGAGADGGGSHLPQRTMTEHPEAYARGVPRSVWFPSSPSSEPARPPPITIPRLSEVPTSLPAPRHRDILNETRETRVKKDLLEMLLNYRSEMVTIMDSRRSACFYEDPKKRDEFLAAVNKQEADLWALIHAVELIISSLDE